MSEQLHAAIADIRASQPNPPPGITLAVATGGRTHLAVDGERMAGRPLTENTSHDIASVTKVVATTASIMRLVDAGELTVHSRVRAILPTASVDDDCSVLDLLQHRAGLWEWWPLYVVPGDPLEALDSLPLRYPPRTGRHYSDIGFMLLGRIVSAVHGAPLTDAVRDLVFDPLGLSSTCFAQPDGDDVAASSNGDAIERQMIDTGLPYPVPLRSTDFGRWRTHTLIGEVNDGNAFHAFAGVSGHAGLFSTVGDLLAFGSALAGGDFVSDEVRQHFFSAGPDPEQALGFRRYTMKVSGRRIDVIGHPGYTGHVVGFLPATGAVVVLATNRLHVAGTPAVTEAMWSTALSHLGPLLVEKSTWT